MENSCSNCRWLHITSSEYAGVGYFDCKAKTKLHPLYGRMELSCKEVRGENSYCELWEQGGIIGWINRHFNN